MRRAALALLAALGATACADLPRLEAGICGNGVVEPKGGEDCDGDGPEGGRCAAPEEANACRFVCVDEATCPTGYACGIDGLCRTPSSGWAAAAAATYFGVNDPLDVAIGDADGDRRGDLFASGLRSTLVHYGAAGGQTAELELLRDDELPILGPIGDLSDDGLTDAVVPTYLGYFVSLGDTNRLPRATAYGALPLPREVTNLLAISMELLPEIPGTEVIVFSVIVEQAGLAYIDSLTARVQPLGALPAGPDHLAGPPRVAHLDEDRERTPCESIVLGYRDATALDVLVPCLRQGTKTLPNPATVSEPLRLPEGSTIAGEASVLDLDHDGHLDLAVVARSGGQYEIDVAYGRGDGSFHSRAASPEEPADRALSTSVRVGAALPLAVHDLDGDRVPDWVDASGIYVSAGGARTLVGGASGAAWTTALVGRFDADDLLDVAVGSSSAPGVTFFLNRPGGYFSRFVVPTRGKTSAMVAGDFDGDGLVDLAIAGTTRRDESDPAPDSLGVAYGAAFGPPGAPRDIGQFHRIHLLATARGVSGEPPVVDGAEELAALAEDEGNTLAYALVFGRGDRDLRAPYAMTLSDVSIVLGYLPSRMAIGHIDADGHADLLTLSSRIDDEKETRLWANPMSGAASIRLDQVGVSQPLGGGFRYPEVLFGTADLDDTPGDEVVVLGPREDDGYQTAILRAKPEGEDGALVYSMDEPVRTPDELRRSEGALPEGTAYNGRLRTADVDGDGRSDVLVLARRDGRGTVLVYFNDGTGELGTPAAITTDLDVLDFTTVQADADPPLELALLDGSSIFVADPDGRDFAVDPEPVLPGSGGATAPFRFVASGDVDGDGLADLAVGGKDGIEVHLGL